MPRSGPLPLDAPCGLCCGACEVLRAEADGRAESAAKLFGVEPGDVHCSGCRSGSVFGNCLGCGIRACASGRGFEFCIDCADFPCAEYERIASFGDRLPPHFRIVMKNQAEIREKGAAEWRRLQSVKWTCPSCGLPFSWYAQECTCGEDLRGKKDWENLSAGDTAFFDSHSPKG